MKKLLLTTAAVLTLSAATFAMAGGIDQPAQNQGPQGGFYVGGGLGYANQVLPSNIVAANSKLIGGFSFANTKHQFNNFSVGAHVGYLAKVAQNFLAGAEVGYTYLPKSKYTFDETRGTVSPAINNKGVGVNYSDYAFSLLAVGKYYVTSEFNVFGKAGIAYVNQSISVNRAATSTSHASTSSVTAEKILPEAAVGVGYNLTPSVELTAQYSRIFGRKVHTQSSVAAIEANRIPSANIVMVGANYYFK